MRGSDVVDGLLKVLPKRWVEWGLLLLVVVMWVTHWYEPVTWYVIDKAVGLTEQLTPILEHAFTVASTPGPAA